MQVVCEDVPVVLVATYRNEHVIPKRYTLGGCPPKVQQSVLSAAKRAWIKRDKVLAHLCKDFPPPDYIIRCDTRGLTFVWKRSQSNGTNI